MIFANVIFPAFTAPYVSYLFFPMAATAAILSEIVVFKLRYHELSLIRATGVTLIANLVSWIAGVILGFLLPSGLIPKVVGSGNQQFTTITQGPHFDSLMWIGFAVAFLLSVLIEFYIWKIFQRKSPLPKLLTTTTTAHIVSYALLIGIAFAYIKFHWW